jgi:superfamily II DNA or RNA helicase
MKVVVQNSFSKIEGQPSQDVTQLLSQVMTYRNDFEAEKGQLFYQLKCSKFNMNNDNQSHEGRDKARKTYFATKARLKWMDDNEYVCLYKNQTFPTGLLNIAIESLNVLQVTYQFQDLRESPGQTEILRWQSDPWEPRYYQKEMIELGLKAGRGVFEAAVGTGKSLVMAHLIKNISCTSLIVVPSRGLSGQLYRDFSEWFGAQNVQLLDAAKIRKISKPKAISIVTVQSLGSLVKSGEFKDFAKHIEALYVDEVHHAGASTYTGLLEDLEHVYYRYGFSGTFLRNDNKTLEMWSFLSNVLYQYPAYRAIQEGYLTPVQVLVHTLKGRPNIKYQTEYDNTYCANPELLEKVAEITSNFPESQILTLVNKKDKCGLVIHEYLKSVGIENSYISGDNNKDEINQTIRDFNDKNIRVLIGSSVLGEGIDIRSTDHLIMSQGGKSEITMVQAAGRVLRLYEGKTQAYIHDFRFEGTRYMIKHFEEREEIYNRNFQCPIHYL